jgi:hypothetical protein
MSRPASKQINSMTLWVPGLLHPQRIDEAGSSLANLQLAALQKLLSKADYRVTKKRDFEEQACYLFHQQSHLPSATLRASVLIPSAFQQAPNDFWLSIDPVQMIPDRDTLVLIPAKDLAITKQESEALLDAFNRHFAEDKVQVLYGAPDQWFMQIKQPIDLQSTSLTKAAYQSLNNAYPRGNAANYWRQLINETQMLFYTHPVNEQRRDNGLPEINSIWPWGEGNLSAAQITPRSNATIFTDCEYLQGLALATGAQRFPQVNSYQEWQTKTKNGNNFIYLDSLAEQIPQMQATEWLQAVQKFEEEWMKPVLSALNNKQLDSVFLDLGANKQFYLTAKSLKRFWRWNKKLTALCN